MNWHLLQPFGLLVLGGCLAFYKIFARNDSQLSGIDRSLAVLATISFGCAAILVGLAMWS